MAFVSCPQCGYDKVEYKITGFMCGKCGCGKTGKPQILCSSKEAPAIRQVETPAGRHYVSGSAACAPGADGLAVQMLVLAAVAAPAFHRARLAYAVIVNFSLAMSALSHAIQKPVLHNTVLVSGGAQVILEQEAYLSHAWSSGQRRRSQTPALEGCAGSNPAACICYFVKSGYVRRRPHTAPSGAACQQSGPPRAGRGLCPSGRQARRLPALTV